MSGNWALIDAFAENSIYGGANILKLTAVIENAKYRVSFHAITFPECSVIRYWFDIENISRQEVACKIEPMALEVYSDRDYDIYRAAWFTSGVAKQNFGRINEMEFGVRPPAVSISSKMTGQYVPLVILYRDGKPNDGIMIEMDYISHWNMSLSKTLRGINCKFGLDEKNIVNIACGETISTPVMTLAAYAGDMDELMVTLYDWQYTYMWDYTLSDYYGKLRSQNLDYPWVYCSRVLNEQFGYRIACMNLIASKTHSAAGIDMGWDDAGWSSFPGWPDDSYRTVFKNTYEGPDHRLSTRYYERLGIYWSADNEYLQYYEIARNAVVIGASAKFRYFSDTDANFECNDTYSVRAVEYGNKESDWVNGEYLGGESIVYSTLGAHGENLEKMNWKAEYSKDLKVFEPMRWVPAVKEPGGDQGGTPNQEGGIGGYFEGGRCAKVGRGWQQASPDVYCVRTFVAPFAGKIKLTGRAVKEWYHSEYGSDLEVCVMKNGDVLVPFSSLLRSDINGISYNLNIEVKAGDVLRFVLGKCDGEHNANIHYEKDANIIGWNSIVEYPSDETREKDFICRINCGGKEYVDSQGAVWSADNYYAGGCGSNSNGSLSESARIGEEFSYKVPVPKGIYAVRLLFCENEYRTVNQRFMQIWINGSLRESELDVAQSVRSVNTLFGKVYHYVIPDENGEIHISLKSLKGGAMLSGIEIMMENDDVYHINCGGEDFVDWAGYVWRRDEFFEGGEAVSNRPVALKQASPTLYDKALYFTGRSGMDFSYKIPVRDGIYSVQLKFAELSLTSPETSPIDIYINGICMKKNYDPIRSVDEAPMSADIRFDDVSSQNGYITIQVKSASEKPAILRAIEVD